MHNFASQEATPSNHPVVNDVTLPSQNFGRKPNSPLAVEPRPNPDWLPTGYHSPDPQSRDPLSHTNDDASDERCTPEKSRTATTTSPSSPRTSLPQIVLPDKLCFQSRTAMRTLDWDIPHTLPKPLRRLPLRTRSHDSLPPRPPTPHGPLPPPPDHVHSQRHHLSPISDAPPRAHTTPRVPPRVLPPPSSRPHTNGALGRHTARLRDVSCPPFAASTPTSRARNVHKKTWHDSCRLQ
ncbi:hypothetical protein LXA43DRAFT_1101592 [Ganoderma leucocontextum]|nr:hypothetical protein LXA43DRAFT_1101592 [Ganoderma leucocontextum]